MQAHLDERNEEIERREAETSEMSQKNDEFLRELQLEKSLAEQESKNLEKLNRSLPNLEESTYTN